jgi:hypothetical protein
MEGYAHDLESNVVPARLLNRRNDLAESSLTEQLLDLVYGERRKVSTGLR